MKRGNHGPFLFYAEVSGNIRPGGCRLCICSRKSRTSWQPYRPSERKSIGGFYFRCVKSDFFSASFNDLHVFPTLPFLRKLPRNIAFILNLQCCILHFILDKTGVKTLVCRSYYTISCGQVNSLCPYFVFFSKDFFLLWSVFFDIYFQNVY